MLTFPQEPKRAMWALALLYSVEGGRILLGLARGGPVECPVEPWRLPASESSAASARGGDRDAGRGVVKEGT